MKKFIFLFLFSCIVIVSSAQKSCDCFKADFIYQLDTPSFSKNILKVNFINTTLCTDNSSVLYKWYYGDDTIRNVVAKNHSYFYSISKSYSACLTAKRIKNNDTCIDSVCRTYYH